MTPHDKLRSLKKKKLRKNLQKVRAWEILKTRAQGGGRSVQAENGKDNKLTMCLEGKVRKSSKMGPENMDEGGKTLGEGRKRFQQ